MDLVGGAVGSKSLANQSGPGGDQVGVCRVCLGYWYGPWVGRSLRRLELFALFHPGDGRLHGGDLRVHSSKVVAVLDLHATAFARALRHFWRQQRRRRLRRTAVGRKMRKGLDHENTMQV